MFVPICFVLYIILYCAITLFIIAIVIKTCTRHAIKPSTMKFIDGGGSLVRSLLSGFRRHRFIIIILWRFGLFERIYIKIVRFERGARERERTDVEIRHNPPPTFTEAERNAEMRMKFITFQLYMVCISTGFYKFLEKNWPTNLHKRTKNHNI